MGEEEDKDQVMNPGQTHIREANHWYRGVSILGPDSATFQAVESGSPTVVLCGGGDMCVGCCGRCANGLILSLLVWGNNIMNDNSYYFLHAYTVPCIL